MKRFIGNHKVLGVLFLALVVGAVYLTYATFSKKFVDYDRVTLQTSTIGLSLPSRADVKIRGVIIGEVLEADTSSDGAELVLGLYPDETEHGPGQRDRLDHPQDAVRREVRLADRPRRRRVRLRSRPATRSPRPGSPPRSSRSSTTSTRCSPRSSRATST